MQIASWPGDQIVEVELILTTPTGNAINPCTFRDALAAARKQAGISQDRQAWHALRHWYVSTLLANGVPITDVAEYTGDTVEVLHRTYAHHIPSAGSSTTRTWRGLQAPDDALTEPKTIAATARAA